MDTSPCRGCGQEIGWIETVKGASMPVDPEKVIIITKDGRSESGFVSHFATCPEAKRFRK